MSSNQRVNLNHNFGAGALSIGFGKLTQSKLYVGGELALNLANRNASTQNTTTQNVNTQSTGGYGPISNATLNTNTYAKLNFAEFDLDGKFGTTLTSDSLIYARLGAAFNKLKINSNSTLVISDNLVNPSISTTSALNATGSRNLVGLRFGLGGEHLLTKNLVAKLDYVFTWYGKTNISGVANVANTFNNTTTTNGLTNSTFAKMNTQTVMVGLSYYFHDGLSRYFHRTTQT